LSEYYCAGCDDDDDDDDDEVKSSGLQMPLLVQCCLDRSAPLDWTANFVVGWPDLRDRHPPP